MIEKSLLPMRLLKINPQQFFSKNASQRLYPLGERDFRWWNCNEEVDMIRHQNVATNRDIVLFMCSPAEYAKSMMDFWVCQQPCSLRCVERHEVEWTQLREQVIEAEWATVEPIFWVGPEGKFGAAR